MNRNRIGIPSRQPGNEQAMGHDRKIALDSPPSFGCSNASCLPPELLAAIFLECDAQDYGRDSSSVPCWVTVSYVFRYWCNVALGCAHLWTRLFFASPKWIDEQLRRSKTAPLIACIYGPWTRRYDSGFIHSLEKLLEIINRIKDLCIIWPSQDMIDIINARLNAPAPLLQSLHLTARYCPARYSS